MTYQFSCCATTHGVRQVLVDLRAALRGIALTQDVQNAVEIAVAEALNNIVEHALPGARNSQIHVEMCADAAYIFVHLQDPGTPMPDRRLPDAQEADLDVPQAHLPEGGFGWGLIHMLADRLDYSRTNGVNQLKMWFEIGMSVPTADAAGPCEKP